MTTPPEPDKERGTAIDRRTIWGDWDENESFFLSDPSKPDAKQLDRMFERDGKARLLEQALTLPMRQATIQFTPGKGDRGELEQVQDALTRPANADGMSTPLWQVIGQATSAVAYRRAFFEKVWAVDGRQWRYDKLAWRPQNSCRIKRDKLGAFQGFIQYVGSDHPGADNKGEITIPPEYAWVFLHGAHRDPLHGIGDFDVAHHNHVVKQKTRFIYYSLFLENSALPKTIVTPGAAGVQEAPAALAKTVGALRNGGVAGLPPGSAATFLPVGDGAPFLAALNYLDADTAASVLAGFTNLTDPAKSGGSNALSESATEFFKLAQTAKLVELGGSLTSWVAADLVRWNFGPDAAAPQISFKPLASEDVRLSLDALTSLAAARGQGVPAEFIDLLVLKVSDALGLPTDRIAKAIDSAQQQAAAVSPQGASPAGQLGAAVRRVANPLAARITADQQANLNAI